MPLPKLEGRYLAVPASWEVGEYNGVPIFEVIYQLTQYQDPQSGWSALQGLEITKRFFLKKNDGSWSEHAITSIMSSLGWDGKSLKSLAEGAWNQIEVQLTVGYETSKKDGKDYIGVLFMNHRDYEGRKLSSDPGIVQSLDAKYGAELRNLAKSIAPHKPAQNQQQKPAGPKTPKESAWNEFVGKTKELSKDDRTKAWYETVKGYSGKEAKELTDADWQNVGNSIAEYGPWKPRADPTPETEAVPENQAEPVIAIQEDDIPF